MVMEAKSTHSLPLPMLATDVVRLHDGPQNNAQQRARVDRARNPIGQILRYVVLNEVRFGALTSASRTYFFRIEDDGKAVAGKVSVSDAFFVGEQNYLRAWAYCYSLSTRTMRYKKVQVGWAADDPDYVHVTDDKGNNGPTTGPMTRSRKRQIAGAPTGKKGSIISLSVIPSVPFASLSFGKPLGYGRNGCVFRADWQGKTVAVKQFDLGRPGVFARFRKEISAYEMLKLAQGVLVPKALFLTQSMGIAYLGLELGT
jgi:hypothetical protein